MSMKRTLLVILVVSLFIFPYSVVAHAEGGENISQVQYVTYNPSTGQETYSYFNKIPPANLENKTLTQSGFIGTVPLESPSEETIAPRTVIGDDNRKPVTNYNNLPYRAICYVSATFPNGKSYRSTGWLFSKDGVVVAGHSIYNPDRGGWASKIIVYPARNGSSKPYSANATTYGLATPYTESQDPNYDYGLLKLDKSIGNTVGYLGYTYNGGAVDKTIRVIGYPSKVDDVTKYIQYESSGKIKNVYTNRLHYTADTSGGQSGSPILLGSTAIGVHTSGNTSVNKGKRIHYDMYAWMNAW